jgi:hypothetical protein
MFCPKCASENPDNGKFCRSCGANLSNVLAAVEGEILFENEYSNKISVGELRSTAIRNIVLGFGFLFTAVFLFTIPPRDGIFWLFAMIPGFCLLASGISRYVKSDALKKESKTRIAVPHPPMFPETHSKKELPPTQTDYVKPQESIYKTDDLNGEPLSITEATTHHLEIKAGKGNN